MNYGNKMNQGGRLYDYMKAGGKLPMQQGGMTGYTIGKGGMKYMEEGGENGDGETSTPAKKKRFGKDVEAFSKPGDREKGTIYYDEDAQGFFEVFDTQTGTESRQLEGRAGDMEKVFDYIVEKGGGTGAIGFPSNPDTEELFEKYPSLSGFKLDADGEPILDAQGKKIPGNRSGTNQGNKSMVKNQIQSALVNGDPLLMSMLLNPYEEGASSVFDNIQPYGVERAENVAGPDRGIQFQSLNLVGTGPGQDQRLKEYGPSNVIEEKIFADGEKPVGEPIIDPKTGETVYVTKPMQTPGFGEGTANPGPDAPPRTREEGAVPYQKKFGGMIRKANEGMRMQRRTVFRFPRS